LWEAQATEADVSSAHHNLPIIMQQHAELSSEGKGTGALLLPAQHAATRSLDRKVKDPQDVVDSAASTREEHQRANYEQDCSGVQQEHGDQTMNITAASRKFCTKSASTTRKNINGYYLTIRESNCQYPYLIKASMLDSSKSCLDQY